MTRLRWACGALLALATLFSGGIAFGELLPADQEKINSIERSDLAKCAAAA